MVDLNNIYQYLQSTDGVNQLKRSLPALDPGSVQLDGRTNNDIINFLYQLSQQISFYDLTNTPQGDWSDFFNFLKSADGSIMNDGELNQLMATRNDWPPHLALLMAFLGVYAIAQKDMNQLVRKHLNYYYKKVLQLNPAAPKPDQVHVTFELTKSASPYLLKQGTLLDAGKDSSKQLLRYAVDNETVINSAVVKSLKSLYFDQQNGRAIVFIADDATSVKSSLSSGWRPFGTCQLALAPEVRNMAEANLGFAIASPALLLAEGERSITITIYLAAAPGFSANDLPSFLPACFDISLTGDKGWISPPFTQTYTKSIGNINLQLTTYLSNQDAPVVSYDAKLHEDGYTTAWPVLRCILRPYTFQLESLDKFVISSVDIEVGAYGIKNLVLQNDESLQPINKPILPFTSFPRIGNHFYIGSTEAFSKSLESLGITLNWKDPPGYFDQYYSGYDNKLISYDTFSCTMSLLAGRSWETISQNIQLFEEIPTADDNEIWGPQSFFQSEIQQSGYVRNPDLNPVTEYAPGIQQGFISIQLSGPTQDDVGNSPAYAPFEAFGHKAFPSIYTVKALALAKDGATPLPNQPYTPTLQSVALSYTAKETFVPDSTNDLTLNSPNNTDQFFMLDAFSNVEWNANVPARLIPKLPLSLSSITGKKAGVLYIGIDQAQPLEILSLLFQMESGSMPGSILLQKEDIAWSYLKDTKWQSIDSSDIQRDTTGTFQDPGIIQVGLAPDAGLAASLMPPGLCWLSIAALQNADGASDISAIVAQAASATRVIAGSDAVISVLPPKTITKLVTKASAIKTVTQSYPSFKGLPAESDAAFYVRVSERLRHRNRPITGWDYERIVLQQFPDLFKAKCLSHTDNFNNLAPGSVKIVVIPNVRLTNPDVDLTNATNLPQLLQPVSNLAYLDKIRQSIVDNKPSPFMTADTVNVTNPVYETLLVDCKVAFKPGKDPQFYSNQLENDIRCFLSPWVCDNGQDITFGGKIYRSALLDFVESHDDYVDHVVNFQLYHRFEGTGTASGIGCMKIGTDFIVAVQPSATIASSGTSSAFAGTVIGQDFVVGIPVDVAAATRPDAILASNVTHRIGTLQEGSFECSGVISLGIGQMIVGLDLIPV
jgi:hypothetical protein